MRDCNRRCSVSKGSVRFNEKYINVYVNVNIDLIWKLKPFCL